MNMLLPTVQQTHAMQVDSSFLVGSQAGGLHECGLAMQAADLQAWDQLNSSTGAAS